MPTWLGYGSLLREIVDSKYKLIRLLGEGGMGSVYEAEHVSTLERVAVKVINSKLLLRPGGDGVTRFRREARAAGAIDSEHIVRVLDSGTDETSGLLYLVMEYLEGEDLQHLIERATPLAPETALRITAQALIGLQKAHEAHIVHRDIKPANLFLSRQKDGVITVKLLDFGIAKIKADPLTFPHTTGLTSTGGFLGSPLYMSPEQVQSTRDVDHRTDIWSLGSTLYCALAGNPPYGHVSSVGQLVFALLGSSPPSVQKAAPWIPREIAKVIQGALALKPEDRYPSAAAMLSAMQPLITGDMALREEMLIPVSSEQRAQSAPRISSYPPPGAQRVGLGLEMTKPISGQETTQEADPSARTRDKSVVSLDASSPLDMTTRDHKALSLAVPSVERAPAPRARVRAMAAGVVLVAGLSGAWVFAGRSPPPPAPANTSSTPAPPLPSPPESAASPAQDASVLLAPIQRVRLLVSPRDASVEVDGVPARVSDGFVEIAGAPGSPHRVRLFNATSERLVEVFVTEQGTLPPKIDLRPPDRADLGHIRPGAPGGKPVPPSAKASASPAASAPAKAALPKSGDDDVMRSHE